MKAKMHSYSLDVNFSCPNCRLFFRLSNEDIPTTTTQTRMCDGCGDLLKIEPLKVLVMPTKTLDGVKSSLLKCGWTKEQADKLLQQALNVCPSNEESDILKYALSFANDI